MIEIDYSSFKFLAPKLKEDVVSSKEKSADPEKVVKKSRFVIISTLVSLVLFIVCIVVYYASGRDWPLDYQKLLALFIFLSLATFVIGGLCLLSNIGTSYVNSALKDIRSKNNGS